MGIVLQGLTLQPFVPLAAMDMDLLTKKAVFLVFLAVGARRSEVLALSRQVSFCCPSTGLEALLIPVPGFVPKSKMRVTTNRPFVIKALPLTPSSRDDTSLCPVRTLQVLEFLSRSERLYGSFLCLFPSTSNPSSPLTTHGLKSLVLDLIQSAYQAAGYESNGLVLRLHDLRRLSFSLASAGGISLEAILSAGRWKHTLTFSNHYLQSVSYLVADWHHLGPLAIAQSVASAPGS
jgi:hypothetical protein